LTGFRRKTISPVGKRFDLLAQLQFLCVERMPPTNKGLLFPRTEATPFHAPRSELHFSKRSRPRDPPLRDRLKVLHEVKKLHITHKPCRPQPNYCICQLPERDSVSGLPPAKNFGWLDFVSVIFFSYETLYSRQYAAETLPQKA
jgi:hypothetical protein